MSVRMCMKCFELYRGDTNLKRCPKEVCYGEVAEIDDLMVPIIKKLNQLGYKTEFCCSGHIYDPCCNVYIKFEPESFEAFKDSFIDFNFDNWQLENEDCIIRYWIDEQDDIKRYETILEVNVKLLKYINSLKSLKE